MKLWEKIYILLIHHVKNAAKVRCSTAAGAPRLVGEIVDIQTLYQYDALLWKNQCKKPHIFWEKNASELNQLVQTNLENEECEKRNI